MSRLVNRWGNYRRTVQCGLLIALSSSHVQATGSAIEYSAPVDCPEKSTFLSDLRQILGHELESIHEISGFHVTTERVGNSYRAVVSSDRGEDHASRTIAGADCSTVAHAAALAVAMAINNDESPAAEIGTLSVAAQPDPAPPRADAAPLPRRKLEPLLPPDKTALARVSGVVTLPAPIAKPTLVDVALAIPGDLGTLPSATIGARLGLNFAHGRWLAGFGLGALLPVAVTPGGAESGARFWFATGRLDGCVRMAGLKTTATLYACAVFEAGVIHGSGIELSPNHNDNLAWLAPGPRLHAAFPLFGPNVRGQIGAETLIPLVHGRFTMDGNQVLYDTGSYVGRLDIGVAVHLK